MKFTRACTSITLASAAMLAAAAPHQHGAARLDVAVEDGKVVIAFESPLDNLVGFERAPRSDAERKRVEEMLAKLRNGDALFRIDPMAQCRLVGVELASAVLKLGTTAAPPEKPAQADHADLDADYTFACAGAAPGFVETTLFATFARLRSVDVQAAGPNGQAQAVLKRGAGARIDLKK